MHQVDTDAGSSEVRCIEKSRILFQMSGKRTHGERLPNDTTTNMQGMQIGASIDAAPTSESTITNKPASGHSTSNKHTPRRTTEPRKHSIGVTSSSDVAINVTG